MEPIRVLCVFSRLDRGGAETMCMNLYRNIDRAKVQFDFVKHTRNIGAFEKEIQTLGGQIFTAPRYRICNHLQYLAWWKAHFLSHPEHQIIHGHFYSISAVYFHFAHCFHRITVGHSHSTNQKKISVKFILKKMLQRRVESNSDYRLACSKEAGAWLFPKGNYTVLHNAIDTKKFLFQQSESEYVRDELSLKGKLVLGAVGRFHVAKNPFGLIEIFKKCYEKNKDTRLLWIGDGSMRAAIQKKLREEGLEHVVILTGVRSDVNRLMQAMDVFLLPSIWEGLPVVLVEAQAAGLPCLVSDTVTREANLTGLCTYLPLECPEQWAEAVQRAAGVPRVDTSKQIADAGYDIATTAKWLENFYLQIHH